MLEDRDGNESMWEVCENLLIILIVDAGRWEREGRKRGRRGTERRAFKKKQADDFFLARGIHSRTAQLGALGSNLRSRRLEDTRRRNKKVF